MFSYSFIGFKNNCKGSVLLKSSRLSEKNCECPLGFFDDLPYNNEC